MRINEKSVKKLMHCRIEVSKGNILIDTKFENVFLQHYGIRSSIFFVKVNKLVLALLHIVHFTSIGSNSLYLDFNSCSNFYKSRFFRLDPPSFTNSRANCNTWRGRIIFYFR